MKTITWIITTCEGYGPGGTGLWLNVYDNRNRTVSDVRHASHQTGVPRNGRSGILSLVSTQLHISYTGADEDATRKPHRSGCRRRQTYDDGADVS